MSLRSNISLYLHVFIPFGIRFIPQNKQLFNDDLDGRSIKDLFLMLT